jgi:uncharacterized protein YicC (UPF0701 family)
VSDYNLIELEQIIAAGEEKLEDLHEQIMHTFTEAAEGSAEAVERYEVLCAVAEGLRERVDYLSGELEEANAAMAEQYEADLQEAIEDYLEEGGELDEEGEPVDKDLLADVFRRMQDSRLENGL